MEPKRQWQGTSGGGPQAKKQNVGSTYNDPLDDDLDLEAGLIDEDEDQRLLEEDLEIELGEAGRNWERPPVPAFDPQNESLSAALFLPPLRASTSLVNGVCMQHLTELTAPVGFLCMLIMYKEGQHTQSQANPFSISPFLCWG